MMELNKIIQGDCLEKLKEFPENSVDSIVTDPPYELGFMGKSWDSTGIANNVEMWKECLRVLKPGGHLLAFSGTRTYHRMASAIEDAGFEIRDMIEWVYGSGFPKSLNIGKSVNQLETNEWSKISKAFDNIDQKSIMDVWKKNALFATTKLSKSLIEVGTNTPKSGFAPETAVLYFNHLNEKLGAIFAELQSCGLNPISDTNEIIVQENAGQTTIPAKNLVRYVAKLSENQTLKSWSIFTAQCDVKEWLNENTGVNHKVDEALKTLRGNKKYSNEKITSVLCVVIQNVLKHTILNQSKTFQSLDTNQKMECASAINVIITEYTAENLISNTVAILRSKAVDKLQGNEREITGSYKVPNIKGDAYGTMNEKQGGSYENIEVNITKGTSEWEGWGTALKPAHEPICMARKPLSEKSVAENCLKYGTGGINIDESRVEYQNEKDKKEGQSARPSKTSNANEYALNHGGLEGMDRSDRSDITGRFPANLIHDNSEEVRECFPETKSGNLLPGHKRGDGTGNSLMGGGGIVEGTYGGDSGNASRFFKSIIRDELCTLCCLPFDTKHDTMSICNNTNVNNAEKSLKTIQATTESTALKSATGQVNKNLVQNVRSAGNLCDLCGTSIAQRLVAIMQGQNQESTLGGLSMPEHKKQILEKCLVSFVELRGNTDTIPTMENLSLLFGYVSNAIEEYTQKCEDIRNEEKSQWKSLVYRSKASKSERNKGCEGLYILKDNTPKDDIDEIKHLLSI